MHSALNSLAEAKMYHVKIRSDLQADFRSYFQLTRKRIVNIHYGTPPHPLCQTTIEICVPIPIGEDTILITM